MKILITGVGGAIGSHLAERLLDLGHEVVGIDALTPYYSPEIKKINVKDVEEKGGDIHILDLTKDNFNYLLRDTDFIFHLAAQPGISVNTSFEDYIMNNIVATQKLLEQAKNIPTLKGFIHASTSSVYGEEAKGAEDSELKPTSYYGVTKLAAEQLAMSYYREYKLPVSALRFFSVYGERERPEKLFHKLIKAICEDKEFPLYEGAKKHIRSFTYVKDIIDGCVLVLENFDKAKGEIFNLGNNHSITTGESINILEKVMGKSAKFIILPKRAGDQKETAANITKIHKFFGYSPAISFEEGITNQIKWYKEKINGKL